MKSGIKITVIILGAFLLASCSEQQQKPKTTSSHMQTVLIPVQQEPAGDINVVVYNSQKDFRRGEGNFVIEFSDLQNSEAVKVTNVNSSAVMHMNGKSVIGETLITSSDTTGRYDVKYNFPVKGTWYINVSFNDSLKVQFIFSVI